MKTLKLFNAVVAKESQEQDFISKEGYIIESRALWAKERIIQYYNKEKLDGLGLNKTFHKSWKKILTSTRGALMIDQIKHYFSTYGSDFKDDVYIPNEILEVPDMKISLKVIKAYSREEMIAK